LYLPICKFSHLIHRLQLLKVLDKWTSVLDEGGVLNAVYMDFMKAFDKVPHTRLLVKMKAYGFSEKICIWVLFHSI
jgi:hypothetical protein